MKAGMINSIRLSWSLNAKMNEIMHRVASHMHVRQTVISE